jgi:hypothetical protein
MGTVKEMKLKSSDRVLEEKKLRWFNCETAS